MQLSSLLFDERCFPTAQFKAFLRAISVPGDDLRYIDDSLQERFFPKNDAGQPKERWELSSLEVGCSRNEFRRHLAACGFMLFTEPEGMEYSRVAWPGALVTRAAVRLADLIGAWNSGVRWQETIVFGGKRPLQPLKEGIINCCRSLGIVVEEHTQAREYVRLWDSLNPQDELDMMRFLWQAASLEQPYPGALSLPTELRGLPVVFVDAPMKPPAKVGGPPIRPTTEDTIKEWLKDSPTPGSMLLSSGAPYGMAQDEAFWMLLGSLGHTVETFGHAAPDLPPENFMREVAGCVHRIRKARLSS